MANVLPKAAQKRLSRQMAARYAIAGSLCALALAALTMIALVPSYIVLSTHAGPEGSGAKVPPAPGVADLNHAASLLKAIGPLVSATATPSDVIRSVLAKRPAGVSVEHVSYTSATPSQVTLSGTGSRDAVNAYRTALEKDPRFTSVYVPVAVLVGSSDGSFSITISGTF